MVKLASSKVSFPDMEKAILQFWREQDIFRRTETEREGSPIFMFYEGPPTANGNTGIHHVLARVFKDVICRYKTMKRYRCLRKGGWDTHGLPVELEIERELGLKSKCEIEEYGIARFNEKCRESVLRYVEDWKSMTDRIGFWVDMDEPYVTLDNDYIETGWWILKELWDKGLLYEGYKVTPHCPRCVTSLSSHEVALGYQENTPDPSVFVKFKLLGFDQMIRAHRPEFYDALIEHGEPVYFLAWTTTPWTLPGNTALAVHPDSEYSLIEIDGPGGKERLILASKLVDKVIKEPHQLLRKVHGRDMVALTYESLYDPRDYGVELRRFEANDASGTGEKTTLEPTDQYNPRVIASSFVSLDEGTGILHIAPAFGEEDLTEGRRHGLNFVQQVDNQGVVIGDYPFAGKYFKDADEQIMADLDTRSLLYRREVYYHTYPFCWRCDTAVLYYAKSSWYIRTTAAKDRLISGNREINWYPEHIKEGRFGEWLANNVDWSISRERYWGTPIPIWQCESCQQYHCVGSLEELRDMAVPEHVSLLDELDLHRPYVDEIAIKCPNCSANMRRIPEVMDAWFDSGAMPFAQYHAISQGDVRQLQDKGYLPADYICEAVDQTRGWFYSLHALATLLTGHPSYRNVICLGLILDGQGRKMSKRLGNVVDPWSVLDAQGADAIRWYLFTASQPGDSRRFSQDLVNEAVRRFLLTLWNVYSFFTTYASVDDFHPDQVPKDWKPTSELDRWLISELNALVSQVDTHLEEYNPTDSGRRIQDFVDRLSNWYVRRSRRRFWRSENDDDKMDAYASLYNCLTTLTKLIAPLIPFVAEEMYQNLVRSVDDSAPESVHLDTFPEASSDTIDTSLMDATRLAMRVSSMGRGARSKAGIKVRQPLTKVLVKARSEEEHEHIETVRDQILDELNIQDIKVIPGQDGLYEKAIEASKIANPEAKDLTETQVEAIVQMDNLSVALEGGYMVAVDTTITPELAQEGMARELVHRIQNLRRSAGFEITDRIFTAYSGPDGMQEVMRKFSDYVRQETLSDDLIETEPEDGYYAEKKKLDGMDVVLGVKRV